MKYLGQILTAILYTPLYTGAMYLAILLPFSWVMSLSFWKMVVAILFLGGLIEGFIAVLQTIGLMPFIWIVKNNKVSFWLSVGLCIIFPILNVISLWRVFLHYGTMGVITAIILTIMFLQFVYGSVLSLCGLSTKE